MRVEGDRLWTAQDSPPSRLRSVRQGVEAIPPGDLPRHRHLGAYATIVVEGCFEQVNYAGRVIVRAGDLLINPTLDCHANFMISSGARILRLHWPLETSVGGVRKLRDADEIIRTAERDTHLAVLELLDEVGRDGLQRGECRDWPDLLAADLATGRAGRIDAWAEAYGLARETVSRGFSKAFGVSPAGFRNELRARRAWCLAISTRDRFAEIAAETGFADQAHMTRSIRTLTGAAPKLWRLNLKAGLGAGHGSARSPLPT